MILTTAVVAGALALTSCSSSGSGTTGKSGGATSGTSESASAGKNPIVVGGVQDGNYAGIDVGFKARIARFNSDGGVDGRKVDFLGVSSDNGTPSANVAAVNKLVLQQHVFALAPYASQAWSPASTQLLTQKDIPMVGWPVAGPSMCAPANSFPVDGCVTTPDYARTAVYSNVAKALGTTNSGVKMAFVGTDNSGGVAGTALLAAGAKKAGVGVVYAKAAVPQGGTSDYTPYVQAILAAKPNAIFIVVDFTAGVGLTAALRQAGFKGAILNPTAYLPGVLNKQKQLAAALQGSLVLASFPTQEEDAPVTQQVLKDLKAIGSTSGVTLGVAIGWYSADEFVQELQATAKAGALTSANFVKTIHGGFKYNSLAGGFTGLQFPRDQLSVSPCIGLMLANADGTYKVESKFECDPSTVVKIG